MLMSALKNKGICAALLIALIGAIVAVASFGRFDDALAYQSTPIDNTAMPKITPEQTGPETDGQVLARLTRLESDVEHIKSDIAEIKADIKSLEDKIDSNQAELHSKIDSNLRWMIGSMVGILAATIGGILGGIWLIMNKLLDRLPT